MGELVEFGCGRADRFWLWVSWLGLVVGRRIRFS